MATAEGVEVPVWVNGVQKWVAGVDRTTTCQQLVQVLLAAETSRQPVTSANAAAVESRHLRTHTIVECWGQTERPLQTRDRVLKAMRCWPNDGRHHVQLLLKKTSGSTSGGGAGGGAGKSQRRRHQQPRHRWRSSSSLETLHPRKLATGGCWRATAEEATSTTQLPDDSVQHVDTVERLMRMIIVQGETIQAQLRRLQERDCSISQYEHKMHQIRVRQLGSDYLLRAYLRDGGGGSGGTAGDRRDQHPEGQRVNVSRRVTGEDRNAVKRRSSRKQTLSVEGCPTNTNNNIRMTDETQATEKEECPKNGRTRIRRSHSHSEGSTERSHKILSTLSILEKIFEMNAQIIQCELKCVRFERIYKRTSEEAEASTQVDDWPTEQLDALIVELSGELARLETTCRNQLQEIASNQRQLQQLEARLADKRQLACSLERKATANGIPCPPPVHENSSLELDCSEGDQIVMLALPPEGYRTPVETGETPEPIVVASVGDVIEGTESVCCQVEPSSTRKQLEITTTVAVAMPADDSNSDTGLSSLHTSSDEVSTSPVSIHRTTQQLNTLV